MHIFDWIYIFVLFMELTSTHKPVDYTRHLHHGSSGYMRKHTIIPEPTSAPKHPQAPTNSLKYIRHLQHGSSGHLKDHTFTAEPTSAHKPCKPHPTPTTWVLGPYERPQPSTQGPQALSNLQNSSRHQHLRSLGNTKDHTLTAKPTSTHKHPQTL